MKSLPFVYLLALLVDLLSNALVRILTIAPSPRFFVSSIGVSLSYDSLRKHRLVESILSHLSVDMLLDNLVCTALDVDKDGNREGD